MKNPGLCLILVSVSVSLWAQRQTASISGLVSDSSSAPVPGALHRSQESPDEHRTCRSRMTVQTHSVRRGFLTSGVKRIHRSSSF